MKYKEITCKNALSASTLPGLSYTLNPYQGCFHQCCYCYVPSVLHLSQDQWKQLVYIKRNIPLVLSKELKKKKPGVVGISTVTDPYQPIEKTYRLTQYCLKQLLRYHFPISIQTKSDLIIRDIDLISEFPSAEVMVSIGTLDDTERQYIEPHSASIDKRLEILRTCTKNEIDTSVFFGPIYPTITKEKISEIIETFNNIGVKKIMIDRFRMKPGILKKMQTAVYGKNIEQFFKKEYLMDKKRYEQVRKYIKIYCQDNQIEIIDAF